NLQVLDSSKQDIRSIPWAQRQQLLTQNLKKDQQMNVYFHSIKINAENFRSNEYFKYDLVYQKDDNTVGVKGPFNYFHLTIQQYQQFQVAFVADFDTTSPVLSFLKKHQQQNNDKFVSIIGGGDYGYDLHDLNGEKGLKFMKETETYFNEIAFNSIAGNHEDKGNMYEFYNQFYRNPGPDNDYYTWAVGDVLFIGFNGFDMAFIDDFSKRNYIDGKNVDFIEQNGIYFVKYSMKLFFCSNLLTYSFALQFVSLEQLWLIQQLILKNGRSFCLIQSRFVFRWTYSCL
ncbi:ser thr protein phosphatase family protein, putative, partial [Ichthyophthirius multifiliis]